MATSINSVPFTLPPKWNHLLEGLPQENQESALREKLKNTPQLLVDLFLDLVLDTSSVLQQNFKGHLVEDITVLTRQGRMSRRALESVLAALQYNISKLLPLFQPDLDVISKHPEQPLKVLGVSRLVLMAVSEFFEKQLGSGFMESYCDSLPVDMIASQLTFDEFALLYSSLRAGDPTQLQDCDEKMLWSFAKQFHLWQMTDWQRHIEKFLIEKTQDPIKAFESLNGCELYNMLALKAHCLKVYGINSLYFKEKNGTLAATILEVTEQNREFIEGASDEITKVSLNQTTLTQPGVADLMHAMPKLQDIHLIVSEDGVSSTARHILRGIPNIKCMKLHYGPVSNAPQVDSAQVSPGSERNSDIPHLQRLDLQGCTKALKRVALSLLRFLPNLVDIRLCGLNWVDDAFVRNLSIIVPNLVLLDLGHCKITDDSLKAIAEMMKKLEMLNLKACPVTGKGLSVVLKECQRINDLNINSCHRIESGFFAANTEQIARIRTLKMQHCQQFTPIDFSSLLTHAAHLEMLNVSYCKGFTLNHLEQARLSNLQVLSFSSSLLETLPELDSGDNINLERYFDKKRFPKLTKICLQGPLLPVVRDALDQFGISHRDIVIEKES